MHFPIRPTYHRNFYQGDCRSQIEEFLSAFVPPQPGAPPLVAAAVPHAGWRFSGAVAARTIKTLASRSQARHVVLFGAVHRAPIWASAVYSGGEWQTPLGPVPIDSQLAAEVLRDLEGLVEENDAVHDSEHSLEVQLPFVHEFFPGVPVLPIMVPPDASPLELGRRMAKLLRGRSGVVIASTDLTHYGDVYGFTPAGRGERAHEWMRQNDRRILDLAARLEAEKISEEAATSHNACGPGALTAVVAFARELGVRQGTVLEYTDSHEVYEKGEPFHMAVGYAGIVF